MLTINHNLYLNCSNNLIIIFKLIIKLLEQLIIIKGSVRTL